MDWKDKKAEAMGLRRSLIGNVHDTEKASSVSQKGLGHSDKEQVYLRITGYNLFLISKEEKEREEYMMSLDNWNAALYDQNHAFVFDYGKDLISLLDAHPGEFVLDLGCGTGHLTRTIAETGAHAVGIDSSAAMIEQAHALYPGITFLVADARTFSLPNHFDAIFSNAALHWMPEAEQVIERMVQSLKAGGRLVAEMGAKGNVLTITTVLREAIWEVARIKVDTGWYFPSVSEYTTLLERHGLEVRLAVLFDRPTQLEQGEQGLRNWLSVFALHILQHIPQEARQQVVARTEEKARAALFRDGHWIADYRRLRLIARLI
jgi:trans-aconitate methyltransferase